MPQERRHRNCVLWNNTEQSRYRQGADRSVSTETQHQAPLVLELAKCVLWLVIRVYGIECRMRLRWHHCTILTGGEFS